MEIKIKMGNAQAQRLKDFGLSSLFKDAMVGMNKIGDRNLMVNSLSRILNERPIQVEERKETRVEQKKKPLSIREVKAIENFAIKRLHSEVQELFETRKKRELFHLVIRRLSPHSLALLVK